MLLTYLDCRDQNQVVFLLILTSVFIDIFLTTEIASLVFWLLCASLCALVGSECHQTPLGNLMHPALGVSVSISTKRGLASSIDVDGAHTMTDLNLGALIFF